MQSITTDYTCTAQGQGRVNVHTWYGVKRVNWLLELNTDENHVQAVRKVLAAINAERGTTLDIVDFAPAPGKAGGYVFLVDNMEHRPVKMSITVQFRPGTNSTSAHMRAFSWLSPKSIKTNYDAKVAPACDLQACARMAANAMLTVINDKCKENGVQWALADYVELYNGDRLFTLKYA